MNEPADNRELHRYGSLAFLPSYQKYAYRNTLPVPRFSSVFSRLAVSLTAVLVVFLSSVLPVAAQVCNPECQEPATCVYTDNTRGSTVCRDSGFLDEPSGPGGPTFATIVYGVVVPLVDLALMPLLYAIAFITFLIGMVRLFFSDSEEKRKSGKDFALWGIIGFAVLFSVWGIVRLLLTLLPMGA